MKHSTKVGLGPGHIVLDGDPAPSPKGHSPPIFGPYLLWPTARWIKMPLGTEVGLGPGDIVLDGDPAPPTERGTAGPSLFDPCLLWPKRSPISATAELLFSVSFEFHSLVFSASTLLGRRQEEHPTCENLHQL